MKKETLSKLQIRAEVIGIISKLESLQEGSQKENARLIKKILSIEPVEYVLDVLVKELPKVKFEEKQIIAHIISDIGTIEQLQEPLWDYIKDPNTDDEVKSISNIILRNLGDTSDPRIYLSYLNDPQSMIDKETDRMLDLAKLNPEAQIDFIDFLYSLSEEEQEELVLSLIQDYRPAELVVLFVPIVEANPHAPLTELIIETLGESKSQEAANIIEKIQQHTDQPAIKKKCEKSLKLLKLTGIHSYTDQTSCTTYLLKESKVYKCYASPPDGMGNQGIIISRLKETGDLTMMSAIVNDTEGIMDCFGFYLITEQDFDRIIEKFRDNNTKNPVNPSYCKTLLTNAEQLNWKTKKKLPYEYAAWKVIIDDIPPMDQELKSEIASWGNLNYIGKSEFLYDHPDFYYWFMESGDVPFIDDLFAEANTQLIDLIKTPPIDYAKASQWLNGCIKKYIPQIFSGGLLEVYYKRLLNAAYIFHEQKLYAFRDLAASTAKAILPESGIDPTDQLFFMSLMKRSLLENYVKLINSLKLTTEHNMTETETEQAMEFVAVLAKNWSLNGQSIST